MNSLEENIRQEEIERRTVKEAQELSERWKMPRSNGDGQGLNDVLFHIANPCFSVGNKAQIVRILEQGKVIVRKEIQEALKKFRRLYPAEPLSQPVEIPLQSTGGPREKSGAEFTANVEGLVDIVDEKGRAAFLIKENGAPKVLAQIVQEDRILLPPPKDQIPWLLPRAAEVLKCHELSSSGIDSQDMDRALFEDLTAYHKNISELPSDGHYLLLAAFDMHTYLLENFMYSPMLCFYAVPERGKSRTGKGIIHVVYRGLHVESLRDAYIVRVADGFGASLFFDVRNIWRKAELEKSDDILLHRFERGARVPRVLYPEKGPYRDTKYFSVFGPTLIATNEDIHHILETRAISITMPDTLKRYEEDLVPERALPLKERLVEFRLRHLGEPLPSIQKPCLGRLGDIIRPLLQIVYLVAPEKEADFMRLVREIERGRKLEKSEGLDAQIIQAVDQLESRVLNGFLSVKEIAETLNQEKPERHRLTPQRIGRRLTALGFEKGKVGEGGASAIAYDKTKLEHLKASYGLEETPETSETPETHA